MIRKTTGAVAQLGARQTGSLKVAGSIPASSTKYIERWRIIRVLSAFFMLMNKLRMNLLSAGLALLLLIGCASSPRWVQSGKTEADAELDQFECRVQLRDRYGPLGADKSSTQYDAELRQCMSAKGYVLEKH